VYDQWAERGNPGWAFADVLDDFRRLERDEDIDDQWHGTDGPIRIRRHPAHEINGAHAAFLAGLVSLGHPRIDDHNRPDAVGAGPSPRNAIDGLRMSTALTYLATARTRANLTIRPDTHVAHVELAGTRARGVRLADGTLIEADRVVLAAGSYSSPMILCRSGIGPAADLAALGIRAVIDLPGVGNHLVDHVLASVDVASRPAPGPSRFQTHVTFHSRAADRSGPADLLMFAAGPFEAPTELSPGGAVLGIVCGLMAPRSRGWIRLRSVDPLDPPRIHPAHLSDPADLDAMVDAVVEARRVAASEAMAPWITERELSPGESVTGEDRTALAVWAHNNATTFHHPVGTCAMGPDPATGAVTDTQGSVHGIEELTVADASIMPIIPTGTTNIPTIMIAERISRYLHDS
jgi:choline dehydrogenase